MNASRNTPFEIDQPQFRYYNDAMNQILTYIQVNEDVIENGLIRHYNQNFDDFLIDNINRVNLLIQYINGIVNNNNINLGDSLIWATNNLRALYASFDIALYQFHQNQNQITTNHFSDLLTNNSDV